MANNLKKNSLVKRVAFEPPTQDAGSAGSSPVDLSHAHQHVQSGGACQREDSSPPDPSSAIKHGAPSKAPKLLQLRVHAEAPTSGRRRHSAPTRRYPVAAGVASVHTFHAAEQETTSATNAKELEWQRHKPKIVDLYGKHSLAKVMDIMKRTYGFDASVKMYKTRIRKWGLDKNVKADEMRAIIRKSVERSQAGKQSVFVIRDIQVPAHRIARCRQLMKLSSQDEALRIRAPTPPGLIVYTPPASPLAMPAALETPERMARFFQEYFESSFENGDWIITEGGDCINWRTPASQTALLITEFRQACLHAGMCWITGDTANAWRAISIAMPFVERIVALRSPAAFTDALDYTIFMLITGFNARGFVILILEHFRDMGIAVLGKTHPLTKVWARLAGLPTDDLMHALITARQSQIDCLSTHNGQLSATAVALRGQANAWDTWKSKQPDPTFYPKQLQDLEAAFGPFDARCLRVRYGLGLTHWFKGRFGEAMAAAHAGLALVDPAANPESFADFMHLLSRAQHSLADVAAAEASMRRAIQVVADARGWENSGVLLDLATLRGMLAATSPERAAEANRQHGELLSAKIGRIGREEDERFRRLLAARAGAGPQV